MTFRQTKITILVDNEAGAGLKAEHGFALWIETGNQRRSGPLGPDQ
jgi:7,8-dihydropterin-6-yl-methyl-4-(beta-D-ribofuranosyl)aminobenzene 5'-phosphate synthase